MKLPERRKAKRPYSAGPMRRVNSTVTTVISTTPAARIANPARLAAAIAALSRSPRKPPTRGPATRRSRSQPRLRTALLPLAGDDADHGAVEDPQVEPDREVADVVAVHLDPLAEGALVAPGDLPEAGDPRQGDAQDLARRPEPAQLVQRVGPGPDEAHLPAHHVDELRQLVQARGAHDPADAGHAGVVVELPVPLVLAL